MTVGWTAILLVWPWGKVLTWRGTTNARRLEQFRRSLVLLRGSVAMNEESDRKELQRRLEQAKRMAALLSDPVTDERLRKLVQDLEEQLREPE
jgi:hypothetical protein